MTASIQVLLATHNGILWLDEQLDSILRQKGVEVTILACDDASTDGTLEQLHARAAADTRIQVLDNSRRFGNAAANFYHLLLQARWEGFGYFALADQDDIWEADKLARHLELLRTHQAAGVSSNVTAFWNDGRTRVLCKSQPQRRWDHLLEPPGPGCSFLMTSELVRTCAQWINELTELGIGPLSKHDWFIYLVARCSGMSWHIDNHSSLQYRQHERNEVGANAGPVAVLRRLTVLARGGYHRQVRHAIQVAKIIASKSGLDTPPARLSAVDLVRDGRRRRHEALVLALFSPFGIEASDEAVQLPRTPSTDAR